MLLALTKLNVHVFVSLLLLKQDACWLTLVFEMCYVGVNECILEHLTLAQGGKRLQHTWALSVLLCERENRQEIGIVCSYQSCTIQGVFSRVPHVTLLLQVWSKLAALLI